MNQNQITVKLQNLLQELLGYPVIKANQHSPAPPYPYVTYTITSPVVANGGTWGEYEDSVKRKPFKQVWSFTVQSNDDTQALELAMRLYDYFDNRNEALDGENIIVEGVSNINNRDNFITIQYEYRYGFDVTFVLMRESCNTQESEFVSLEINCEGGK